MSKNKSSLFPDISPIPKYNGIKVAICSLLEYGEVIIK